MLRFSSLAVLLIATPALAQQPAPPAPALGGTPIPGLCLLSTEAIYANALVGKAATARLQQLATQAQAEIDAERKPIDADIATFRSQEASLTPEQRAQRQAPLAARLQAIEAKAQLRSREIEATRQKARERISTEAQSVIAQVYSQFKCGLVIDRNTVLGGNMANDLTPGVVRGLDAKIQTITFNREVLPTAAAAPAAAPAPAPRR